MYIHTYIHTIWWHHSYHRVCETSQCLLTDFCLHACAVNVSSCEILGDAALYMCHHQQTVTPCKDNAWHLETLNFTQPCLDLVNVSRALQTCIYRRYRHKKSTWDMEGVDEERQMWGWVMLYLAGDLLSLPWPWPWPWPWPCDRQTGQHFRSACCPRAPDRGK